MKHGAFCVGVWVVVLAVTGCSAVPKPPTVSGTGRIPVNTPLEVDLQACKSELTNTKLMLGESSRLADSATATLSQMAARCTVPRTGQSGAITAQIPATTSPSAVGSAVYVLHFGFGRSSINLTEASAIALSDAVKTAQLIVIRGRTDGFTDTAGETRVAKARAEAVQQYLVALGIDPARIRATHQAAGDFVANNDTEAGRAMNRRAEIEVYQTMPTQHMLAQGE